MIRFVLSALALFALTACPGPAPVEETDDGGAQRLAGAWDVEAEVSAPGLFREYRGHLTVTVDGAVLQAAEVCPDGSGRITALVTDREAPWTGVVDCPVVLPDCEHAVMSLRNGSFWIENGSELVAAFNGVLTGCGNGKPMLVRYRGRK